MAVALVARTAASATLGGDPVCNVPAGTTSGQNQIMLAWGVATGTNTITAHADWTTHPDSVGTSTPLWYRVVTGSEPASYTFVTSGAANAIVAIATYSGVNTSNPFAGTAGKVATVSTTVTITAANPTVSAYLAQIVGKLTSTTWTPPASASPEDWDATIGGVGSTAGGHETVGSGSTGTRVWTAAAGAGAGVGYAVPLRVASQQVTVTGFAPAVVFGTPTLVQDQFVTPSGFTPNVVFGSVGLRQKVTPSGFAPTVVFGTPTLIQDQFLPVTGFTPTVVFGTPGLRQSVAPSGFTVPVVFGTPNIGQTVTVDGFTPTVVFGTPAVLPIQTVTVDGFQLPILFGDPTLIQDGFLPVTGFTVPVVFGTPSITMQPYITACVFDHETGNPVGAGIPVVLFDENNVMVDSTVTDAGGCYLFHVPFGTTLSYWTLVRVSDTVQGASPLCEPIT